MKDDGWTSLVDRVAGVLERRTSRRGFLARTAVVGSAITVGPWGFLTRPVSAYAAVCGVDATCSSGYTAFCATVNGGVNRCPPGSLVGGWWKSDGSGFCCGNARYYIDCHSFCSCGCGGRSHFCGEGCRNCSCGCGPQGQCDQRKVCCNEFRYGQCNQDVSCTGPVWCRVVTCTPPWRIPSWKCSTTSATDQRTNNHSAPSLQDCTAIGTKYTALGGQGGFLREATTPERTTPGGGGVYQHFDGGSIYWSGATGAHAVRGEIRAAYERTGWEAGPCGFPVTDEFATPDERGRYSHFAGSGGSSVYWSPATGAHAVHGEIRDVWESLGWETGPLGYPTTDELRTPEGAGRFNHFEGSGGSSVYWSPATGAHAVLGEIRDAWATLGWEGGPLGYPITSEAVTPNRRGNYNHFQRGSIYWSPRTSAHVVAGAIRDRWAASGWEGGPLGFPTTDETPTRGGSFGNFENGSIYTSPATGPQVVTDPVRAAWLNGGGASGPLRLPTGELRDDGPGRRRQDFQGGFASVDVATGVVTLTAG